MFVVPTPHHDYNTAGHVEKRGAAPPVRIAPRLRWLLPELVAVMAALEVAPDADAAVRTKYVPESDAAFAISWVRIGGHDLIGKTTAARRCRRDGKDARREYRENQECLHWVTSNIAWVSGDAPTG
jgi:hypothetical protein